MEREDPEMQNINLGHRNNQSERTIDIFTTEFIMRKVFPIMLTIINSIEIQQKIENVYQNIRKLNPVNFYGTPFGKTLDQAEHFFETKQSYFIIFIDLDSGLELVKRPDLMEKIKEIHVYAGQDLKAKSKFDQIKLQNQNKVIQMWRDVNNFLSKAERQFVYCKGYQKEQDKAVVSSSANILNALFPDMFDLSKDKSDVTSYRRILLASTKMFNSKQLSRYKNRQLTLEEYERFQQEDKTQKLKWLNQFYTFIEKIYFQNPKQLNNLQTYKNLHAKNDKQKNSMTQEDETKQTVQEKIKIKQEIKQKIKIQQTVQYKMEEQYLKALQFYSRDTFYYKVLNLMLRFCTKISEFKPITVPFNETYNGIKYFYNKPEYLQKKKLMTQKQLILYRGTTLKDLHKLKIGTYVQILGFLSTSKHKQKAVKFLREVERQSQQGWLIVIEIPQKFYDKQFPNGCPGFFDFQWLNMQRDAKIASQKQVLFNVFNVFKIKEITQKNKSGNLTQKQEENNFNTIILEYGAINQLQKRYNKGLVKSRVEKSIIQNIRLFRHEMQRIQDMGDVFVILQKFDQAMQYRKNNRRHNNNLSDDVKDMQIQLSRGKIDQSYKIAIDVVNKLQKQSPQTFKNLKNKNLIKSILIQKENYLYTKKMLTMQINIYKEKSEDIQTNLEKIQVFCQSAEVRYKEGFFSECQNYFKMGIQIYQQNILKKIEQKQKQFKKRQEQLQKQKNEQKSIFSSFLSCFCSQDSINQQNQKIKEQLHFIKCQQRIFKNKYQTRCLDIQLKLNVGLLNCLNQIKSYNLVEKQKIINKSLKSIQQYMDSRDNSNKEQLQNQEKSVQQMERIKRLSQPKSKYQQQSINSKYKQSTYQLPQQFELKRILLLNQKNKIQSTKKLKQLGKKFDQKIQIQQNNPRTQQQSQYIFLKLISKTTPNTQEHAELKQAFAQWRIQNLFNQQNNPDFILVKKDKINQSQQRKVFDNEQYQKQIQSITQLFQSSITTRASLTSQEDSKVLNWRTKFASFLLQSNIIKKAAQQAQMILKIQKTKIHTNGAKAMLTLCRIHFLKGQICEAADKSKIALEILKVALIKDPKQAQYYRSFQMSEIYGEIILTRAKILNKQSNHTLAHQQLEESLQIAKDKVNYKQNPTQVPYFAPIQEQIGYILVNKNIQNIKIQFEKHFKKAIILRQDQRGYFNIPNAICYCRMASLQVKFLGNLINNKIQLQRKQLAGQTRQQLIKQLTKKIRRQRRQINKLLEQAQTIFSMFPVDHPHSWIIYSNKFSFDSSNRINAKSNQQENTQINNQIEIIRKCTQLIKNRYGLDSINYMKSKFKHYCILKKYQRNEQQSKQIIQQLAQYLKNDKQIYQINNPNSLEAYEKSEKYRLYNEILNNKNYREQMKEERLELNKEKITTSINKIQKTIQKQFSQMNYSIQIKKNEEK